MERLRLKKKIIKLFLFEPNKELLIEYLKEYIKKLEVK
jgi:hypothetical protein